VRKGNRGRFDVAPPLCHSAFLRRLIPLPAGPVNNEVFACRSAGLSLSEAIVCNNGLALRWCREATGSLISLSAARAAIPRAQSAIPHGAEEG
jgi:hypothetical protein